MAKKRSFSSKVSLSYLIVAFCFGLIIVAILGRIFVISFVEGNAWRKLGEQQVRPNIQIPATRGNIYSANYELMATTESRYRLYLDYWADGFKIDTLNFYIDDLSAQLNKMFPQKSAAGYKSHILAGWKMKEKEAQQIAAGKKVPKKSREYRLLDNEVNYLQLKQVRRMPFLKQGSNRSGLYTKELVKRTKPYGTLASRTIGDIYGEFEKGGMNGLEKAYDTELKGIPGVSTRRKVNGRMINVPDVKPVNGIDIISTIDIKIQDITEKALRNKLMELNAESGTAIVMEVNTGEIKAITNLGRVREGVWAESKNFAVSDLSEPGSTFKVVSMMVALEDGLVHPDDVVETGNGLYQYGGFVVRDHNAHRGGYGTITASKAIRYSSNVGVAKVILKAYEKNPEKYVEGIYKIGLNKDLELEIPGYGVPNIRHPKDKARYWSQTTLPWMSFGYETQVPPIYTLTFFNGIANGGKMVKPMFVREIQRDGKTVEKKKIQMVNEHMCSPTTLAAIQEMLDDVVNQPDGTGKPARSDLIRISGKTGTAQLSQGAAGYRAGTVSHQVSFCGYFPSGDPKYSCIVVIRRPRSGAPSGGFMCGTVFKQIAEEVYSKKVITTPEHCPVDSLLPKTPRVKSGLSDYSQYALNKLKINYVDSLEGKWMAAQLVEDKLIIKDRKVGNNIVPNVVGMGAKDAVYALENVGLNVLLTGRGEVRSQSISAGNTVSKGQTITIQLK